MEYYLSVDENGKENVWCDMPSRNDAGRWIKNEKCEHGMQIGYQIPKGRIEEITGKKLTWEDEPLLYNIESEDVFEWDTNFEGLGITKMKISLI